MKYIYILFVYTLLFMACCQENEEQGKTIKITLGEEPALLADVLPDDNPVLCFFFYKEQ